MLSDWASRLADKVASAPKPEAPVAPPRAVTDTEKLNTYLRLIPEGYQRIVETHGADEARRYVMEMERLRRTMNDPSLLWGQHA